MDYQIITISRQYGSGGREIGALLAEKLNIPFYDKEIIAAAAKKSGIKESFFENAEKNGKGSTWYNLVPGTYFDLPLNDKIYIVQSEIIREFAKNGPCVIVGRCANGILKGNKNLLNIFIHADIEYRKNRAIAAYGDLAEKIEERIAAIDKRRIAYFNFYTNMKFGCAGNYQLCIDSGYVGINGAVDIIKTAYLAGQRDGICIY